MLELSFRRTKLILKINLHRYRRALLQNAFYKSYNTVPVQIRANKYCNIPQYM